MLRTFFRGAPMLSPSPFSPTARPAKAAKAKAGVETSTPASVKPTRIEFGGIQRAAELPDDLVPNILDKLFDCDLSALRVAAVNRLWKQEAQEARLRIRADEQWSVHPPLSSALSEFEHVLMHEHSESMYDGAGGNRLKLLQSTPSWYMSSTHAMINRSDMNTVLDGWLTGIAIDAFAMYVSFNIPTVFYSDIYAAAMLAGGHDGPPLQGGSIYHMTSLSYHFAKGRGAQAAADRLENVPSLREAVSCVNSHYHIYNLQGNHWILLVARCDTMTVEIYDGMLPRGASTQHSQYRTLVTRLQNRGLVVPRVRFHSGRAALALFHPCDLTCDRQRDSDVS